MMLRTPGFWYRKTPGLIAWLLVPMTLLWLLAQNARRIFVQPTGAGLPVICIGNITAGGTGKTPLVAALARIAAKQGRKPVILMRGHGGAYGKNPVMVKKSMTALEVGDEAVLLRELAPVVVARNRARGAELIEKNRLGNIIIMDDGMQNPHLAADMTIACFNGRLGIGNGFVHPAGPLREPFAALRHCDGVTITGHDRTGLAGQLAKHHPHLPVHRIERRLIKKDLARIRKKKAVAFAGIGDGEGFFSMLEDSGVDVISRITVADHGGFNDSVIAKLRDLAAKNNARLVTTEKDMARLGRRGKSLGAIAIGIEIRIPASLINAVIPPKPKAKGRKR